MKARDKIYVKEFDEGISQMWSSIKSTETTANVQHEYIRKDALLKWLDGKLTIEGATEGFVGGYDSALKDVINHIRYNKRKKLHQ